MEVEKLSGAFPAKGLKRHLLWGEASVADFQAPSLLRD